MSNTAPTDPAKTQEVRIMIGEMVKCLTTIDGEKEQMKEIASEIEDKFSLPKKQINKIARLAHQHKFSVHQAENSELEDLYETIMGG